KKINKKFSKFLINRLEELEKNQSWLAKKIKVTKAATSFYIQGKITPREDLLKKISVSLKVDYKTLEDLIK
nr:helix-turn-helix transcriptional regulator [Candidatus Woesearchaeota archaeon]